MAWMGFLAGIGREKKHVDRAVFLSWALLPLPPV